MQMPKVLTANCHALHIILPQHNYLIDITTPYDSFCRSFCVFCVPYVFIFNDRSTYIKALLIFIHNHNNNNHWFILCCSQRLD